MKNFLLTFCFAWILTLQECACTHEATTTIPVSDCERRREEIFRLPIADAFIPECDVNGLYNRQQCDGFLLQCWCVNRVTGEELEGSRASQFSPPYSIDCDNFLVSSTDLTAVPTRFSTTTSDITTTTAPPDGTVTSAASDCESRREELLSRPFLIGAFIPECEENGLYQGRQCFVLQCWCVNKITGEELQGSRGDRFDPPYSTDCDNFIGTSTPTFSTFTLPVTTVSSDCPPDRPLYNCFAAPCNHASCPAVPDATCTNDYCGGCFANFTDKYGNPVSEERCQNTTAVLTCPLATSSCDRQSVWLCQYIKWRIEFLSNWQKTFEEWRNRYSVGPKLLIRYQCQLLPVVCTNPSHWRAVHDYYGCIIPYCADGLYENQPGVNLWLTDQELWQTYFRLWETEVHASTSSSGCN